MAFSSGRSDDVDPDGFFGNISKAQSLHNLNRRNSGTKAYNKAFNDLRDKLADQEAVKKARADFVANLISLAVTILIGGWMSVRLGRATRSRAVGDAARYMPGEAFGEVQKKLGAAATSGMAGAGTQNSLFVVTTTMMDKLDFYLDLDTWVTAHNVSPNSVHTAIKRSGLPTGEKDALANHASRTRFIADAPSGTRVASTERAAEAIERALWMDFR
ncbi:hypothetical protein [Jannaschia rubra]|uniref:Uncharacterized protein n=1 Tax=Jannaschia rubra TaxID=282197 RepID=A0A0M6XSD4_9RHOB|nr:hypothetical protein [Jannaschia rubra]CTQ33085.1 hypothetical protein JAN5088_01861 [Jannaschia rubra]SFG74427.1 hypothetical protein SAMN04488517_11340 [Jannaschia rubra]